MDQPRFWRITRCVRRASATESGVLARAQELERLQAEREERSATLEQLETNLLLLRAEQQEQDG